MLGSPLGEMKNTPLVGVVADSPLVDTVVHIPLVSAVPRPMMDMPLVGTGEEVVGSTCSLPVQAGVLRDQTAGQLLLMEGKF